MDFNIQNYGAVADGVTNNAAAIRCAIEAASQKGGRVVVPAGRFLSGTICLKSNIEYYDSRKWNHLWAGRSGLF